MKIINHTRWRTDQLKALIQRVAQDELDTAHRKAMVVTIKDHGNASWVGGHAWLGHRTSGCYWARNSVSMTLKLPRKVIDPVEFASTCAHEMAHTRGLRHPEMRTARYSTSWKHSDTGDWREIYAYAKEYPIERKPERLIVKPGDEQKHAHALAMVKQWQSKTKAATTHLKKWAVKVRYYERKMAAKTAEKSSSFS